MKTREYSLVRQCDNFTNRKHVIPTSPPPSSAFNSILLLLLREASTIISQPLPACLHSCLVPLSPVLTSIASACFLLQEAFCTHPHLCLDRGVPTFHPPQQSTSTSLQTARGSCLPECIGFLPLIPRYARFFYSINLENPASLSLVRFPQFIRNPLEWLSY